MTKHFYPVIADVLKKWLIFGCTVVSGIINTTGILDSFLLIAVNWLLTIMLLFCYSLNNILKLLLILWHIVIPMFHILHENVRKYACQSNEDVEIFTCRHVSKHYITFCLNYWYSICSYTIIHIGWSIHLYFSVSVLLWPRLKY